MANEGVLVHTGPLVALLSERDQHHAACVSASKTLRGPFFTSWAVIKEAAYLLKDRQDAVGKLLSRVRASRLRILQLTADDVDGISGILTKYGDQDFDFADSTLMHLSQREGIESVFTVDQRHFSVFRTAQGNRLILVPESM